MMRLGSSLSLTSFAMLGSSLSVTGFAELGSSLSLMSMGRLGSSLSLTSFAMLGSSLSVASFGRFGSGLTVNGNLYVTGNISYGGTLQDGTNTSCGAFGSSTCASDRRLKDAIRNLKEWRSDDWQKLSSSSSMRKEEPSLVHQEDRIQSEGALVRDSSRSDRPLLGNARDLHSQASNRLLVDSPPGPLDSSLESSEDPGVFALIDRLEPVSFLWKEGSRLSKSPGHQGLNFGFEAQAVREILPSVVVEDREGYLNIRYLDFIPIALAGLKQQKETIKEQKEMILSLQSDNRELQLKDREKAEWERQKEAELQELRQNIRALFSGNFRREGKEEGEIDGELSKGITATIQREREGTEQERGPSWKGKDEEKEEKGISDFVRGKGREKVPGGMIPSSSESPPFLIAGNHERDEEESSRTSIQSEGGGESSEGELRKEVFL
uniref:Peptidase S74 domain-containing protein n=1 Tax=Chromera velia CCMP2878 TaxID=1169474 RepID=A0A0G4HPC0_9ALVE|eukprot:Cvel_29774.t1-p1 / transcript=Cvel_29774.t1 / gene=Cvel_29774 / organism=Chromera_velia_CCMP2878 / gene_product=hypothetical protein / transcript_product=hypothetical protein / location=Cvel_scaffold4137:1926-5929(+) / protein_length=437 / sequence_SO=supercontig / SO=protein_coding / is_pseudo=false